MTDCRHCGKAVWFHDDICFQWASLGDLMRTRWLKFAIATALAVVALWHITAEMEYTHAAQADGFPDHADLLAVLGGGWTFREITAARLFHQGLAQRVLLMGMPKQRDSQGFPVNRPNYRYLLASGIPQSRIELDGTATNTWEEVMYIRDRLDSNPRKSVLIVTDPPHLRRLNWVCRQLLAPAGIRYRLVASEPDWWDAARWWGNPSSAKFVALECLKLMYYQVRYP